MAASDGGLQGWCFAPGAVLLLWDAEGIQTPEDLSQFYRTDQEVREGLAGQTLTAAELSAAVAAWRDTSRLLRIG